jgi:uncharacterized protein YbjT (DUF2867 family)
MTKVLILGANGQIARAATALFLKHPDVHLSLFLRRPQRLKELPSDRVHVIEGDVLDRKALEAAMAGQDVVYANLAGPLVDGAAATTAMTHIAIVEQVGGKSADWMEKVSDEQYRR